MAALGKVRMAVGDRLRGLAGQAVVIGVSGGVDSLVLLHAALEVRKRLRLELIAATFDHGLRGSVGAADADAVVELARIWGVACARGEGRLAEVAASGSVEAIARVARYDFLAHVANEAGALAVAVGHHADDQAETVLAHLVRGAGLAGLVAMRPAALVPGHPDLALVRPLLSLTRADIEAYAATAGLQPRLDATNADVSLTRNKIRLEVMPLLRAINTRMGAALARTADQAAVESDYLEAALDGVLAEAPLAHFADDEVTISVALLQPLHLALARRLVMRAIRHLVPLNEDAGIIATAEQVSAVLALVQKVPAHGQVNLRHGLMALMDGGEIKIKCEERKKICKIHETSSQMVLQGDTMAGVTAIL